MKGRPKFLPQFLGSILPKPRKSTDSSVAPPPTQLGQSSSAFMPLGLSVDLCSVLSLKALRIPTAFFLLLLRLAPADMGGTWELTPVWPRDLWLGCSSVAGH